jgi:hypothetical protein
MPLRPKPGPRRSPRDLTPELIAPCGMNCGLCMCFLRDKDTCPGCRAGEEGARAKSVLGCSIRNCETVRSSESGFCGDCAKLPCPRLKRLDVRYREKYRMSMLANLRSIRDHGVAAFVEAERERWACPQCGGLQCVHTPQCMYCGHPWRLVSLIEPENLASKPVAAKVGMSLEKTLVRPGGALRELWSITASERPHRD